MPEEVRDGSAPAGDPLLGFAVVGVLAAVVLAACVVRTVPPHQRLVVPGRRHDRVRGPGLIAVWPPAARCVEVPVLPRELTVGRGRRRDRRRGRDHRDGHGTVPGRRPGPVRRSPRHPAGSGWAAVDTAVEAAVRRHVAAHDLAAHAAAVEPVLADPAAVDEAARRGVELGPVALRGLTVAVDRQLVHWATTTTDERT